MAHDEIRIGQLAIRFLVEGRDSGGSVAMFEFAVEREGECLPRIAMMLMRRPSMVSPE
jgi:hypothetical protein